MQTPNSFWLLFAAQKGTGLWGFVKRKNDRVMACPCPKIYNKCMLGLCKNTGQYAEIFQQISDKLRSFLGPEVTIEHVGSTAFDNIDGKGIIDVLIGLSDVKQIEIAANKLVEAGYFLGKHNNPAEGYVFLASTPEETKEGDNHIHLTLKNSNKFTEYIKLREYFRANFDKACEYSDLKYKIAKSSGFQRDKYRQIKSKYIEKILDVLKDENL